MTKRIFFYAFVPLAAFILLFGITNKKKEGLHYETFETAHGWGYNILTDQRILIHQETVPTEAGPNGFQTKGEAESTAKLVMEKLAQGCMPSIERQVIERIEKEEAKKQ